MTDFVGLLCIRLAFVVFSLVFDCRSRLVTRADPFGLRTAVYELVCVLDWHWFLI